MLTFYVESYRALEVFHLLLQIVKHLGLIGQDMAGYPNSLLHKAECHMPYKNVERK